MDAYTEMNTSFLQELLNGISISSTHPTGKPSKRYLPDSTGKYCKSITKSKKGKLNSVLTNMNNIVAIDESNLSQRLLECYQSTLQKLQNEKNERSEKVSEMVKNVCDLCDVLCMDSSRIIDEVHPSMNGSTDAQSKSISDRTLYSLENQVFKLKNDKKHRLRKVKDLASQSVHVSKRISEQTDTPEERDQFGNVTCYISASVDEVTTHGALALDLIEQTELEVERLESKVKEIYFEKHTKVIEASRDKTMASIDYGCIKQAELRVDMDNQTEKEALSLEDMLDAVHDICVVLGTDSSSTIAEVHPRLNGSTARLADTFFMLKDIKKQRLHKLKELASKLISSTFDEVTTPGTLAQALIMQAEEEVEILDRLKVSRVKEITFQKLAELEEIFAQAHIKRYFFTLCAIDLSS